MKIPGQEPGKVPAGAPVPDPGSGAGKQRAATAAERKSQVGTGDRSERIRTYNYPQGRVTDHRIGLTLHKLPDIINGDLDELLDALMMAEQAKKLQQVK